MRCEGFVARSQRQRAERSDASSASGVGGAGLAARGREAGKRGATAGPRLAADAASALLAARQLLAREVERGYADAHACAHERLAAQTGTRRQQ